MSSSKRIDEDCLSLAKAQGEIFEASSSLSIPSYRFLSSFMRSHSAASLDGFPLEDPSFSKEGAIAEAKKESEGASGAVYGAGELHWMGYIYRVISYLYGFPSKRVLKEIPPSYLRAVYQPYHTMDPSKAAQIILSDRGISPETKEGRLESMMKAR